MRLHCAECGAEVERYPRDLRRSSTGRFYCSECYAGHAAVKRTCEVCGHEFTRYPSHILGTHSYCSWECASNARTTRVVVECAVCGKVIERKPSEVVPRSTCSLECRSRSEDYRSRRSLSASRQHFEHPIHRSRIEFEVEEVLRRWGFDFIAQRHLHSPASYAEGSFGVNLDFYLPELGVAIECNGTYWHSDPRKYRPEELNVTQRKSIVLYRRKLRLLRSMGIPVIELWEMENHLAEDIVLSPLILFTVCRGAAIA
jgi:hypothetical protein